MRKQTAEKVASLIQATSGTLTRYHRPRKLPGQARPEATAIWSHRPVRPTHPNAMKFSLTGALKADAKALGYSRTIVKRAAEWIEATMPDWAWYYASMVEGDALWNIRQYDANECDTRAVVRTLRAAQKNVESYYLGTAA